jgi:two-component system CheB/CheR fusion protein
MDRSEEETIAQLKRELDEAREQLAAAAASHKAALEEVNHRVRNMLTVVSVVARQSMNAARSPQHFSEAFIGRVNSLVQSYSLVSRQQWAALPLRDVILTEIQPNIAGRRAQVDVSGPAVSIDASQAMALGLVIHELIANAVKFGALSNGTGRLDVTWTVRPGELTLDWRESGGPTVAQPDHRGFGTELVERQMSLGFGGSASFDYAPAGLHVTMSMPHTPPAA